MIKAMSRTLWIAIAAVSLAAHADDSPDPAQDILVTYHNEGAASVSASFRAPYQNRKRYRVSADVRRNASAVEKEYVLTAVDHWPIDAIGVYCFVYRPAEGADRDALIAALNDDDRIDSAQPLNTFRALSDAKPVYNDKYLNLQHGLDTLAAVDAHRYSRGRDVRIAIIDSHVDTGHEDLAGRIAVVRDHSSDGRIRDHDHGTAVASVIGAHANNALGIVGVAPEAELELHVSCWAGNGQNTLCDSFSLAKALSAVLDDPPALLNLSLQGPEDALIGRLLDRVALAGTITIAADDANPDQPSFPASMDNVIGVAHRVRSGPAADVYAPGRQIMVALPEDNYDFRSGSSLAAAHVTGVAALLLSLSPGLDFESVRKLLRQSQSTSVAHGQSVDACKALALVHATIECRSSAAALAVTSKR